MNRSKQTQRWNKEVRPATPASPAAPALRGIDFTMADFDKLSGVGIELRDADLFLRLLVDDAAVRPSWETFALLRVAHQRLGLALKLFESAQEEWTKRLKSTRVGRTTRGQ